MAPRMARAHLDRLYLSSTRSRSRSRSRNRNPNNRSHSHSRSQSRSLSRSRTLDRTPATQRTRRPERQRPDTSLLLLRVSTRTPCCTASASWLRDRTAAVRVFAGALARHTNGQVH